MTIIRQGEVRMQRIAAIPNCETRPVPPKSGVFIVGESESHHHVLDAGGVMVMERIAVVPEGMRIFYAIVENATRLWQTGGNPHGPHDVPAGTYEISIKREFNPFLEQARRVAD